MGNLTRDPELQTTNSGSQLCKISIASSRVFNDKNGDKRDETTFVDCEAWGRAAETISKDFAKGNPIHIEGRLKFDQ